MVFNEISLKQQVAKLPLTEQFSGFLKVCQELKHGIRTMTSIIRMN